MYFGMDIMIIIGVAAAAAAAFVTQRPTAPEVCWANELCRPGSCFTHTHKYTHKRARTHKYNIQG